MPNYIKRDLVWWLSSHFTRKVALGPASALQLRPFRAEPCEWTQRDNGNTFPAMRQRFRVANVQLLAFVTRLRKAAFAQMRIVLSLISFPAIS